MDQQTLSRQPSCDTSSPDHQAEQVIGTLFISVVVCAVPEGVHFRASFHWRSLKLSSCELQSTEPHKAPGINYRAFRLSVIRGVCFFPHMPIMDHCPQGHFPHSCTSFMWQMRRRAPRKTRRRSKGPHIAAQHSTPQMPVYIHQGLQATYCSIMIMLLCLKTAGWGQDTGFTACLNLMPPCKEAVLIFWSTAYFDAENPTS